jgi:hypothetical protein
VKIVAVWLAVKVPVGVTDNQLSAVQLCGENEAVPLVLLCAVTESVWEFGGDAPATALNVRLVVLRVSDPAAPVTLRVISHVSLPSSEDTVTVSV